MEWQGRCVDTPSWWSKAETKEGGPSHFTLDVCWIIRGYIHVYPMAEDLQM